MLSQGENLMSIFLLSLLCGFLTAQHRSNPSVVLGILAFALTLIAAAISLDAILFSAIFTFIISVLAFNIGLIFAVFGQLLVPTPDTSP